VVIAQLEKWWNVGISGKRASATAVANHVKIQHTFYTVPIPTDSELGIPVSKQLMNGWQVLTLTLISNVV
jgi:hypothetical protein